jgi:G protein beta subunit-like protein
MFKNFFAGYQHIRMFDLQSMNANPLINYDGVVRNVTVVGFQEDGKWMFTGGEDNSARIWDLRLYFGSSWCLYQLLHAS